MAETVIVPIDIGHMEKASAMVETAKRVGGEGARIVLLNVIEEMPQYIVAQLPRGYVEKAETGAREELQQLAQKAAVNAEVVVKHGAIHRTILDVAENEGAGMIVIASHKPGLQDYLLGSTAARVVRHANCSVVVMR